MSEEMNPLDLRRKDRRQEARFRTYLFTLVLISIISVLLALWGIYIINQQQTEELNKANEALQAMSEINTCLFVIHIPEADVQKFFPGADVQKCKEKLGAYNNSDGTFLPREVDGQGTSSQPATTPVLGNPVSQNTSQDKSDQQPGPIEKALSDTGRTISNTVKSILP